MGANSGLAASSFIQAGASASSAISSAGAARAKGAYESKAASTNATLADLQAEDARRRGEQAAMEKAKQDQALMGAQRASLAGQGVALDKGSAADVQNDTVALSEMDQLTIRNNAAREAFGYKVQSANYRGEGEMAELSAKNDARNSILTGGMNALAFTTKGYGQYRKHVGGSMKAKSGDEDYSDG